MRLVRLVYASRFNMGKTDPSELAKIHETAQAENPKHDITGMLVFGNDFFLQCLEGGREAVNRLYSNISADSRHDKSLLLEYAEIFERDFEEWSMKLVLLTPQKQNSLRKFSITDTFDPFKMNGPSAYRLMLSLRHY